MFDSFKKTAMNNKFYILLLLLVIILFSSVAYYYYNYFVRKRLDSEYVDNKEFVSKNSNENETKEATLYLFYTTWCPYCKVSRPQWDKLKEQTGGVVKNTKIIFREIDCDKNTDIADKFKVDGYPTIKLIYNDKIYDYDAKPSVDTLKEFLNSVIN